MGRREINRLSKRKYPNNIVMQRLTIKWSHLTKNQQERTLIAKRKFKMWE